VRRGQDEQAVLHVDRAARQVALAAVERPGERRVRAPAAHRVEGLRVDAHGRAQLDLAPHHGEGEQQRLDQVPGVQAVADLQLRGADLTGPARRGHRGVGRGEDARRRLEEGLPGRRQLDPPRTT
jgi:hypothetical protein